MASISPDREAAIRDTLREVKLLGARYYALTGKPLGVTGEIAELEAAEKMGLSLAQARTTGFDAFQRRDNKDWRVQIKGRAVDRGNRYRGMCPAIKYGDLFDSVLLVLLDRQTLDAIEIWEADEASVAARLSALGGKARTERGAMAITQFKSIATKVWPA